MSCHLCRVSNLRWMCCMGRIQKKKFIRSGKTGVKEGHERKIEGSRTVHYSPEASTIPDRADILSKILARLGFPNSQDNMHFLFPESPHFDLQNSHTSHSNPQLG